MIDHEQLAEALQRLDAHQREVLHLSLRRRVPDASLGEVLGCDAQDVARRRAAAIDTLADDLGVQRGEDLGHMLKALLEPETWAAVEAADAEASAEAASAVPADVEPEVTGSEAPSDGGSPEPDEAEGTEPAELATAAETVIADQPANGAGATKPVLEMLTRPPDREQPRDPSRAAGWILAGTLGIAALIAAAGFAGAVLFGNDDSSGGQGASDSGTRHFTAKMGGPLATPFPSYQEAPPGYLVARVKKSVVLYRRPKGRKLARLAKRTQWGSPRVLSVVKQRRGWLGVLAPELRNGVVGWLPEKQAELSSVPWVVDVDLSKRALFVRKDGHTVRRVTIAVGGPGHPTPTGRMAVTDRLNVVDKGSPYGCCVLALTGHQVRLPPDWPGGDRLAMHATADTSSIGKAVSLGCMRLGSSQARWLIETVPLGAPVFIRS
jgi:lipoprotein-anchoring transpeptidase ErfK/SrfK